MFTKALEHFASFQRIPMRVVVITALASYVLQISAILQGQPLYIVVLFTLLPWIPLAFFEGLWKYEHYNWIAVFAVVTVLQVGHIAEHTVQVVELAFLNGSLVCPPPVDSEENARRAAEAGLRPADQAPTGISASLIVQPGSETGGRPKLDANGKEIIGPPACGVFGQLDFEAVHLVWDTLVWIGALVLLTKSPDNVWLWITMIAASIHEVEHLFLGSIFFFEAATIFEYPRQLWATTVSGNIVTAHPVGIGNELVNFYEAGGKIGILGQDGMVERLIGTSGVFPIRPYLHFIYNSLVVIPTVIAFLVQVRRVYDQYLARALPVLSEEQMIWATPRLESGRFTPGSIIIRQGDPADKFYILTKGQVEVVRERNGQEIVVTRLGDGQYFGEIGLLDGGTRIATVRTVTATEVLALDRASFHALMEESDMSREELDRVVRWRVRQIKAI